MSRLKIILVFTQILVGYTSVFSIYSYLPFLKAIAEYFLVTPSQVQFLLSAFFLGIAVPRLFYGIFAEKIGILKTLLFGLLLFLLGGVITAVTTDYFVFFVGRFLQGFGMSAAGVLGIPILLQAFSSNVIAQQRVISIQMSITSIGPVFSILFASLFAIEHWHNMIWVTNYMIIASIFLYAIILPQLKLNTSLKKESFKSLFNKFLLMMGNTGFIVYVFTASLAYASIIMLVGWLPFIKIEIASAFLSMTNLYYLITLFLVLGGLFNAIYGVKISHFEYLLTITISVVLLLSVYLIFHQFINHIAIVGILVLSTLCAYVGIIMPLCVTSALQIFSNQYYLASSLYSFIMNLSVSILTFILSYISAKTLYSEMVIFFLLMLINLIAIIYFGFSKANEKITYLKGI